MKTENQKFRAGLKDFLSGIGTFKDFIGDRGGDSAHGSRPTGYVRVCVCIYIIKKISALKFKAFMPQHSNKPHQKSTLLISLK